MPLRKDHVSSLQFQLQQEAGMDFQSEDATSVSSDVKSVKREMSETVRLIISVLVAVDTHNPKVSPAVNSSGRWKPVGQFLQLAGSCLLPKPPPRLRLA